ncbi:MAG: GNAT family N-acetyltransferase [Acidobacteriota bacterium]
MKQIVVRGYTPADLDAMFALDVLCFDEPFRFSRRTMQRFAEAKKARVVIAELVGDVVGFAIAHVERVEGGRVGYVVTLDVAEPMRRHGLATTLMQRLEVVSREAGCDAMVLHVYEGNEGAIRFYERMGYERVQRARGFYGPGVDGWVYRKILGKAAVEGGA